MSCFVDGRECGSGSGFEILLAAVALFGTLPNRVGTSDGLTGSGYGWLTLLSMTSLVRCGMTLLSRGGVLHGRR